MRFTTERETLLSPLQSVIGVVERRQTMPVLANVLLAAKDDQLSITATDLEVELVATTVLEVENEGEITVPGRKFLDICRALPDGAAMSVGISRDRLLIRSGRSRFTLSTLPAAEFPTIEDIHAQQSLTLAQSEAKQLIEKTHFAMAQHDVRYYLNGLLLEVAAKRLRAVATDGHRLSLCDVDLDEPAAIAQQVIVPRKGVMELQRLLHGDGKATVAIGTNHIRVELDGIRFTSKLIDGRFPEYERVIPETNGNHLLADREQLRHALHRTAILSNEKYRGIRLDLKENMLTIQAHNPEQEEAEEEIEVNYSGAEMEIGFNVNYLLDALGAVDSDTVEFGVRDGNSSCLIREPEAETSKFVVMPMRL